MSHDSRLDAVRQLSRQLRRLETRSATDATKFVSTGISALDQLLPGGGITRGSLIEWLATSAGSGAATLAFLVASRRLQPDGTLVVIDPQRRFYPPAAAALGIALERTVVVQPSNDKDTLWSLEQSLRCPGVAVSICHFNHHLDQMDSRAFRRLQLAVETGNGFGFLLRSARFCHQSSWADVRFRVKGLARQAPGSQRTKGRLAASGSQLSTLDSQLYERYLQLELLRCRNNSDRKAILIGIDDETGVVRLVSKLAPATRLPRAARA